MFKWRESLAERSKQEQAIRDRLFADLQKTDSQKATTKVNAQIHILNGYVDRNGNGWTLSENEEGELSVIIKVNGVENGLTGTSSVKVLYDAIGKALNDEAE